ncbi:MAG: GAF domain-containing protein [Bacilli bacterium]|nr:GAF domain-containing protein [Bacilli bacterium]
MEQLTKQLIALIDKDLPLITNLSNASALLNTLEDINWCGFYLKDGDALYLGPFQGDVACTRIPLDKGVCGKAAREAKTIIVPNVNEFAGHIACSSLSKSEIVTPIIVNNEVKAVIDIDAPIYNRFNQNDQKLLEELASVLAPLFI